MATGANGKIQKSYFHCLNLLFYLFRAQLFHSTTTKKNLQLQNFLLFLVYIKQKKLEVALGRAHPAGILAGIGQRSGRCHGQRWRQRHESAGRKQTARR